MSTASWMLLWAIWLMVYVVMPIGAACGLAYGAYALWRAFHR